MNRLYKQVLKCKYIFKQYPVFKQCSTNLLTILFRFLQIYILIILSHPAYSTCQNHCLCSSSPAKLPPASPHVAAILTIYTAIPPQLICVHSVEKSSSSCTHLFGCGYPVNLCGLFPYQHHGVASGLVQQQDVQTVQHSPLHLISYCPSNYHYLAIYFLIL